MITARVEKLIRLNMMALECVSQNGMLSALELNVPDATGRQEKTSHPSGVVAREPKAADSAEKSIGVDRCQTLNLHGLSGTQAGLP